MVSLSCLILTCGFSVRPKARSKSKGGGNEAARLAHGGTGQQQGGGRLLRGALHQRLDLGPGSLERG